MRKNTLLCVDLKTIMQKDALLKPGKGYEGILTRDGDDHYLFEEAVRKETTHRNPKLFKGSLVCMSRKNDGKYLCSLKLITRDKDTDYGKLAAKIHNEILEAFKIFE